VAGTVAEASDERRDAPMSAYRDISDLQ